jgi:23S rRNA (cytidine1920-2'-O)/16S rRNA (cytidine1409-2'-O)-methyltransferase
LLAKGVFIGYGHVMTDQSGKTEARLDVVLVERGFFESRSRARDAILRGTVSVNGTVASKAGATVSPDAAVFVDDPASGYVSRAALKLVAGLDRYGLDPTDRVCLDVGASTGGFTEVLLRRGARRVVAIDVGHGQMHERLRADPRVTAIEGLNARDLDAAQIGDQAIQCVVADVSFISLKLALPPALALAQAGAFAVLLVKPQFEAGREAIGKSGIVDDEAVRLAVADDLQSWLDNQPGWRSLGVHPAPISGGDGNQEYLLGGVKR